MAEYKWEVGSNQLTLKEGDTTVATLSGGLVSALTSGTQTLTTDELKDYLTFTPYQPAVEADPNANPPVEAQAEKNGTITLKEAALGTSDITLKSTNSHYTLALEGADATSGKLKLGDAAAEKWTVSANTASHYATGTPTTYTVVAAENKITYAAKSTQDTADITITGLKPMTATALAPLITITPKAADASAETKGTITIAASALPEGGETELTVTLTTGNDKYNLKLDSNATKFDTAESTPKITSVTEGTATITRTQSAGWNETTAGTTFTYKTKKDKTLATISNLSSNVRMGTGDNAGKVGTTDGTTFTEAITISGTSVTLKENALGNNCVSGSEVQVSIADGNSEEAYQTFTLALDPSGTNYNATNHTIGFETIAKTWEIESSTTGKYMSEGTEEGWTLVNNKVTYTGQVDPTALVTITNLNSPVVEGGKIGTKVDNVFTEGITIDNSNKVVLSENILTTLAGDANKMNTTVTSGYSIELANGIDKQATVGDISLGGNSDGTVNINQVVNDFWSIGSAVASANNSITYTAASTQKLATITNLKTDAKTSGENADVTLDTTNSEVKIILGSGALTNDTLETNFTTVTKETTPVPAVTGAAPVTDAHTFVFALAGGISAPEAVPSTFALGTVDSSAHTVDIIGTKAKGWELDNNSTKIKYTGDTPVTLATIDNLDDDASSETSGGNITLDSETKTVTLAAEALKTSQANEYTITLQKSNDNSFTIGGQNNQAIVFGLSLAEEIAEPATTITGQAFDSSETTIADENLLIKGKLVEGWTLSKAAQADTVNNQIIYTPEQTKTLATITGLKNSTPVADDNITFNSTTGEVKLKAAALDAKDVTITPTADLGTGITDALSSKYYLAIGTNVPAPYATVVTDTATLDTSKLASDGIVELKGTKAAGYTLGKQNTETDTVNNQITYTAPSAGVVVATIAGLSKTSVADVVSFESNVVKLKKAALTTGDVTLTNETETLYSLALDSTDTTGTNYNPENKSYGFHTVKYWAKTGVNAEYWKQTAEGWTLNSGAKGITYSAPAGDTRLATIKNLSADFTIGKSTTAAVDGKFYDTIGTGKYSATPAENKFVEGVKVEDDKITLSKNVLGTNAAKPMTITNTTGNNFSLALDITSDENTGLKVPTGTVDNKDIWILGSTAIYKKIAPEKWDIPESGDNKGAIVYTAQKDVGDPLATITGLNPDVKETDLDIVAHQTGGTQAAPTITKGTITLNAQALNKRDVTITSDYYKLALNTGTASTVAESLKKVAAPTLSNAAWELNDAHTIATYSAKVSEGYEAASDGSSVTYTEAADSKEIARVTGLNGDSKLVVSDDKQYIGIADGSTVSEALKFGTPTAGGQKPIVLSKEVLGTSNVSVTGTNYILELGADITKKGKATADAQGKVTVTAPDEEIVWRVESIAAKAATSKTAAVPASTTATYKKVIPAYYTLGIDKTAITYTPEADKMMEKTAQDGTKSNVPSIIATVTGLKSGLTVADDGKTLNGTDENGNAASGVLTLSGKAVTLTKDALGTSNVEVKEGDAAGTDKYTLAFTTAEGKVPSAPTDGTTFTWSVSSTTATLKGTSTEGYTLVTEGTDANKKVTYTPANANKTFAVLKDLKSGITASELNVASGGPIVHDKDTKKLTLDMRVLGESTVTLDKTNSVAGYTLALEENSSSNYKVDQIGAQKKVWTFTGNVATYKNVTDTHYTLGQQEGTTGTVKDKIAYVERKDATTNAVIATITGLKTGLKVENDAIAGITQGDNDTTFTISKDVLANGDATITGTATFTLANGVAPEQDGGTFWTISSTNASYQFKQTAGHLLENSGKTIKHYPAATKTIVTIEGLKSGIKLADVESGIIVSDENKTYTMTKSVLGTAATTTLKNGDAVSTAEFANYKFVLATGDDAPATSTDTKYGWVKNGNDFELRSFIMPRYELTTGKNDQEIKYTSWDQDTLLATVTGLNTKAKLDTATRQIEGIAIDSSAHTVTLNDASVFNAKPVEIKKASGVADANAYTLKVDNAVIPKYSYEWTFKKSTGKNTANEKTGTATLTETMSAGYTAGTGDDAGKILYNAKKTVTTTIAGLNNNVTASSDKQSIGIATTGATPSYSGITFADGISANAIPQTGAITLGANVLAGANVTLTNKSGGGKYTLALDTVEGDNKVTPVVAGSAEWYKATADATTAVYRTLTQKGYAVAGSTDDTKITYYSVDGEGTPTILATLKGINKNATVADLTSSIVVNDPQTTQSTPNITGNNADPEPTPATTTTPGNFTIKSNAILTNTTLTLTGVGEYKDYQLLLDSANDDLKVTDIANKDATWTYSKGTANLNVGKTEGWSNKQTKGAKTATTEDDVFDYKTIVYTKPAPVTIATVSGLAAPTKQKPDLIAVNTNDKQTLVDSDGKDIVVFEFGANTTTGTGANEVTTHNATITLSAKALTNKNVTVTIPKKITGYAFKLDTDGDVFEPIDGDNYWTADGKGKAVYQYDTAAGYTLNEAATTLAYAKAKTTTLATITGLDKTKVGKINKADNKTEIEGIGVLSAPVADDPSTTSKDETKNGVIKLWDDSLLGNKVTVTGNYEFELADEIKVKDGGSKWYFSGGTATYRGYTTAGYEFATTKNNNKEIVDNPKVVNKKAETAGTTYVTVKGLAKKIGNKDITADMVNEDDLLVVNEDHTVTISKDITGTATITLVNGVETPKKGSTPATYYDYQIDAANSTYTTRVTDAPVWTFNKGTATLKQATSAGFTLGALGENGQQKLTYSKAANPTVATVKGLSTNLAVASEADATANTNLEAGKIYAATTTGTGKNAVTNITGDKPLVEYNASEKIITISQDALTTKNVSLTTAKTDGYKLALDGEVANAAENETEWVVTNGKTNATATYKNYDKAYHKLNDASTGITYFKPKDVKVYATVKGLALFDSNTTDLNASGVYTANNSDLTKGGTLKLDATHLGTSTITIATTLKNTNNVNGFSLALATDDAATAAKTSSLTTGSWSTVSGGKSTLSGTKSKGFYAEFGGKTLTYLKDNKSVTVATITGVKGTIPAADNDGKITLTADNLTGKNVTITTAMGDTNYTLNYTGAPTTNVNSAYTGYGSGTPSDTKPLNPKNKTPGWTISKNTGTLKGYVTTAGYTKSASGTSLTYTGATQVNTTKNKQGTVTAYTYKDTTTLATIKGLKTTADKTALIDTSGATPTIKLTKENTNGNLTINGGTYAVSVGSDYTGKSITGSAGADDLTVEAKGKTITGGKGDDKIDLGSGGNTFVYNNGDGNDVIANFTAGTDKLQVNSGAISVGKVGSNVVVKVGAGSINLGNYTGTEIDIYAKDGKTKTTYAIAGATGQANPLLVDDNYSMDAASLSDLVKGDSASFTPYDFSSSFSLTKEDKLTPQISYSGNDKK